MHPLGPPPKLFFILGVLVQHETPDADLRAAVSVRWRWQLQISDRNVFRQRVLVRWARQISGLKISKTQTKKKNLVCLNNGISVSIVLRNLDSHLPSIPQAQLQSRYQTSYCGNTQTSSDVETDIPELSKANFATPSENGSLALRRADLAEVCNLRSRAVPHPDNKCQSPNINRLESNLMDSKTILESNLMDSSSLLNPSQRIQVEKCSLTLKTFEAFTLSFHLTSFTRSSTWPDTVTSPSINDAQDSFEIFVWWFTVPSKTAETS